MGFEHGDGQPGDKLAQHQEDARVLGEILARRGEDVEQIYLDLEEQYFDSGEKSFDDYLVRVSTSIFDLMLIEKDKDKKRQMQDTYSMVLSIRKYHTTGQKEFYTPDIDAHVKGVRKDIELISRNFYQHLGLDPAKMKKVARLVVEKAVRRELSICDWVDSLQNAAAKYLPVMPLEMRGNQFDDPMMDPNKLQVAETWGSLRSAVSIGPLQIKPATYLQALMFRQGLKYGDNYNENLKVALENGVIRAEDDLVRRLLSPRHSLDAYEDIMRMYVPEASQQIEAMVNGQRYKIPMRDVYTFSTTDGQRVQYNHDELRLMIAITKYQGGSFIPKQQNIEIQIANGEIVLDDRIVINPTAAKVYMA